MNLDLMMPGDELMITNHEVPYQYKLKNAKQKLYYFGSKHVFDPNDKQVIQIKECFQSFIKETKDEKRIVFVEGGHITSPDNEAQAIKEQGEMGLMVYLAKKYDLDVYSPEPSSKQQFENLTRFFGKEDIVYHFFAMYCYQYNRMLEKPDFEEYITPFLTHDMESTEWDKNLFSLKKLKEIHKSIFSTDFDSNNKDFFHSIIDPTSDKSIVNRISKKEWCGFRDEYILKETEKYWNLGYSIFVIYGFDHAVIQERVLRDFIEKK